MHSHTAAEAAAAPSADTNNDSTSQSPQPPPPSVIAACIDRFRHAPAMPREARQAPVTAQDFWWLQAGGGAKGTTGSGDTAVGGVTYPDPDPLPAPVPVVAATAAASQQWMVNGGAGLASGDEGEEQGGLGGGASNSLDARAEELLAVCRYFVVVVG